MPKPSALSACLLDSSALVEIAASADGGVPDRVLLMRYGANKMRDGRADIVLRDRAHAEEVVAATVKVLGTADFNFDYDHQAFKSRDPKVATRAAASGWAKGFEVDETGIWASQVEWTPAAATALSNREYRYISPTFMVARASRELIRFINAALTNLPALELEALAASHFETTEEEDPMNLKAIAASLGLAEDADEAAILAAIAANKTTMTGVAAALAVEDGGDLVAAAQAIATNAGAGEPDPKLFIPVAAHQAALDGVNAKLEPLLADRRTRIVEDAVAAGQIVPAQKDWALSFVDKHGEEEFASYLKTAPAFSAGRIAPKGEGRDAGGLTQEQEELCASMGWDRDEYLKTLKEEA